MAQHSTTEWVGLLASVSVPQDTRLYPGGIELSLVPSVFTL